MRALPETSLWQTASWPLMGPLRSQETEKEAGVFG